jgi:hypothetical protein
LQVCLRILVVQTLSRKTENETFAGRIEQRIFCSLPSAQKEKRNRFSTKKISKCAKNKTIKDSVCTYVGQPLLKVAVRFARWYIFIAKFPFWVNLGVSCNRKCLFYGHLVHFLAI